jgi:hypothetical protein
VRVNLHTPNATPTLEDKVLVDFWNFKERFQGLKLNGLWCFLYHWKAFGTYMSKMGSHFSFGHLKHKLWPKEGMGVKLPIWLSTTKSQDRFDLLGYKGRATYCWKALVKNYNFASNRIAIWGLLVKLWGSKIARVPTGAISGVSREKSHLDVAFVTSHRVYYKGEGDAFSQVRAMVSLMCSCCPWPILAPRVLELFTNHFVWIVCRLVWVSEACQLFLIPSRHSNTPLYSSKCYELGSVPQLLPLSLCFTWTHIWILKGGGSASLPFKVLWARERAPTPPSSIVFYLDSHLSPSRS